ncbi:MAG: SUMF1/EgtB/PvdO family nonheme iron enzyme [Bacteroidales bacterium]
MNFKGKSPGDRGNRKARRWVFLSGIVVCIIILAAGNKAVKYTSTDQYCMSCHVHPVQERNWKLSTHYNNKSGNIVHCTQCHLAPKGHGYLYTKAKHGMKDLYGYLFKDSASIDWQSKKLLENAKKFVYESSCKECHQNLFPVTLSKDGVNAHLSYTNSAEGQMNCINCHIQVGHYDKDNKHARNTGFGVTGAENLEIFNEAARADTFQTFTEKIPGTSISFRMMAVPGGSFRMGSPDNEPLRDPDEGPVREVKLSPFWMGEVEVTWSQYLEFFRATSSQGRMSAKDVSGAKVDAISGPTPPWGAPDQGWGKGDRPAITMSWHAAETYCRWLSKVTGKHYRLPTEAEWEYAARAGTSTPYFFEGDPKKFTSDGFFKKIFKPDTAVIASRVNYKVNSMSKTREPATVKPNSFGLRNMLGNVYEFCLDFYSEDAYSRDSVMVNPTGPLKGQEHVIRGGSFKSDAADVRSAARDFTKTRAWLVTDPQMPKSIWWYSDCIDVGFRVVCEPDSGVVFRK